MCSLRYCVAHSFILTLLVILSLLTLALWKACEQTKLFLNQTRHPAPFADSEILDFVFSSNNNNNNNDAPTDDLPSSDYKTEGIISATQAANALFSPSQLTQAFGVPMLVIVTPNPLIFSSSQNIGGGGEQMQNFLGNLNVTVWWAVVEACMAKYSNYRTIVRSGFGDPGMIEFFPKLVASDNSTANAFLWLEQVNGQSPNGGGTSNNFGKNNNKNKVGVSSVSSSSSSAKHEHNYDNVDDDNVLIRQQIKDECLTPNGNKKPILEVSGIQIIDIQSALQRTRASVAYRWPASILLAATIIILFVSYAASKTIIDCEVKSTLISLLRSNSASTGQTEENIRNSIANNESNSWSDELILEVAARRVSAKSALRGILNRWQSSHSHHASNVFDTSQQQQQQETFRRRPVVAGNAANDDASDDLGDQNLQRQQQEQEQFANLQPLLLPTPPPSLEPSSSRKLVIFSLVFVWFFVIAGIVPFLMSIAAMELVFAIKGTDDFHKQSASPYFPTILVLVVFLPFSVIHMIQALKVVDCLYIRDLHAEFCAFLKQESIWVWFWFSPTSYWLSSYPPPSVLNKINNNNNNNNMNSSPLVSPRESGTNNNNNNNSSNNQVTYQRISSSQLTSSTYNNMYETGSSVTNNNSYYRQQHHHGYGTNNNTENDQPNRRSTEEGGVVNENNNNNSSSVNNENMDNNNNNNTPVDHESNSTSSSSSFSCFDQILLSLSGLVGVVSLPVVLCIRSITHCPVQNVEKNSRRFLSPVLVSAFLIMCAVGSVIMAEQTFGLVGACVLACSAFLLITLGLVLPCCSCAFLGALMILSSWYRSALIDPVCDIDDGEIGDMFFFNPSSSSAFGGAGRRNSSNIHHNPNVHIPPNMRQTLLSQENPRRSNDFVVEHPGTVHAAYVAYKKEFDDFDKEEKNRKENESRYLSVLSLNDGQHQQQQQRHESGNDDDDGTGGDDNKKKSYKLNIQESFSSLCCCTKKTFGISKRISACFRLIENLAHNKGSRRKLLILRWVILVLFVIIPMALAALMFTQVHLDSCGWEHFLEQDRQNLQKELLVDNRTRYLLPYATFFDFCLAGSTATSSFFSSVSSTHYTVSNQLGYQNSMVDYFFWDVTRNNVMDQTYNANDAIVLEIFSPPYVYLNSVLLNAGKSASMAITIPDFDPFGSVLGGKHDEFVQKVRNAVFANGNGAPLPPSPSCNSVKNGDVNFLAGVSGGSAPQIVEIQSARACCNFFWPILVGPVVIMIFFILSQNDFKIISVLKHNALRRRLTSNSNNNNNKRRNIGSASSGSRNGGNNNNNNSSPNQANVDVSGNANNSNNNNNLVKNQTGNNNKDASPTTRTSQSTMLLPNDEDDSYSASEDDDSSSNHLRFGNSNLRGSISSHGSRNQQHNNTRRGDNNNNNNSGSDSDFYSSGNNNNNNNSSKNRNSKNNNTNNGNINNSDSAASQAFVARMKTTLLVCCCLCFNTAVATSVGMASAAIHASFFTPGCKSPGPGFLSPHQHQSNNDQTPTDPPSIIFPAASISFVKEGDPVARLSLEVFRTTFFPGIAMIFLLLELSDFWCYIMLPFQNRNVDVEKLLSLMEQYARAKNEMDRNNNNNNESSMNQGINNNNNRNNNTNGNNNNNNMHHSSVSVASSTRGGGGAGFFNYQQYLQYSTSGLNNHHTNSNTMNSPPSPGSTNNNNNNFTAANQNQQGRSDSFGSSSGGNNTTTNNNNNNRQQNNTNNSATSIHSSSFHQQFLLMQNNHNIPNIAGRSAAVEACGANTLGKFGKTFSLAVCFVSIIFWIVLALSAQSDLRGYNGEGPLVAQFWLAVGCAFSWKSLILNLLVHPAQRHWSLNLSLFATS